MTLEDQCSIVIINNYCPYTLPIHILLTKLVSS